MYRCVSKEKQPVSGSDVRLDSATVDAVDAWRAEQPDQPSRAEAVQRLVERSLAPAKGADVVISDGEKLIVAMLADVHKSLKVKGEIDPDFVMDAIYGGHFWALAWQYGELCRGDRDSQQLLFEVCDILDMWSSIERAYEQLSAADKTQLEKDAAPFGEHVRFSGFDGNYQGKHLSIAQFLIERMNRYSKFKDRNLNSTASIDGYRRMLPVFETKRASLAKRPFSVADLIELLRAQAHPSYWPPA
jgi:uncharacterized protein